MAPIVLGHFLHYVLCLWGNTDGTMCFHIGLNTTQEVGKVAEKAEDRKVAKYWELPASHSFTPIAIATMGAIGPGSMAFLNDLEPQIAMESGKLRSTDFLITVAICGSANGELCSVRGT